MTVMIVQSLRVDLKGDGAKILLYLASPETLPCWLPEGKFRIWFSRKQENACPGTFLRFCKVIFCTAEKWGGHGPPGPLRLRGSCSAAF